jgi:hypothetical protein
MKTVKPKIITWETFVKKYNPIKNNIDKDSGFDGFFFETFGEEYKQVKKAYDKNPKNVWTIIDADDKPYIRSGWSYVNRLGYIITKKEWEHESIEVENM